MKRPLVWLQLLIGWLPVWALFTVLILTAHGDGQPALAALLALRLMIAAALLGPLVYRLTERLPWPRPLRPSFVAIHLVAAGAYSLSWFVLNSVIESVFRAQIAISIGYYGLGPFLILGVWLYVMIGGVAYATQATERAARAEVLAARAQLAALRAQLNPHFLFNALHTVVHLIPREPTQASHAAEQLAGLLRTVTEEDRDLITVQEEWEFVRRYLDIEALRFGERLAVEVDFPPNTREALIPSFSVQTLVENAVRHAVTPRVESTTVLVGGRLTDNVLTVTVRDNGASVDVDTALRGAGTGLRRLRDRLVALFGDAARLDLASIPTGGLVATLVVPHLPDE